MGVVSQAVEGGTRETTVEMAEGSQGLGFGSKEAVTLESH